MKLQDAVNRVADELDLPIEIVDKTYKGYWQFIRTTIQELPLKNVDEDQFDTLKTNFNIPALGKLYCSKERWLGVKKRFEYVNKIKNTDNVENN